MIINDVTPHSSQYAITINPQPTKLLNRKMYKQYSHEQQRSILTRIESALRRNNPSIVLLELHYEICPILKQVHFHALYSMPPIFVSTLETYYKRILDSSNSKTLVPWRFLDIQPIYNQCGWIQYIRKDINLVNFV